MSFDEALKFKASIERKLLAEQVNSSERDLCISKLSKCVMGAMLVKAYDVIYWGKNEVIN